jgi:putative ABC transport system permease protein
VVGDVVPASLTQAPAPTVYEPMNQFTDSLFRTEKALFTMFSFTVLTTGDPVTVERAMPGLVRRVDAEQPVESFIALEDVVAGSRQGPLFQARLLVAFSALALVLAAVGTYGVFAFSVTERTREMGIRIALGAEPTSLLKLVLRRGLLLALVGTVGGLFGSLAVTRVLRSLLYDTSVTDPVVFAGSALVLIGVALIACYVPALRAVGADPVQALRAE